jgi:hypothetical protein
MPPYVTNFLLGCILFVLLLILCLGTGIAK